MTKRKRNLRKLKKKTSGSSATDVAKHVANGDVISIKMIDKLLDEAESAFSTFNYEEASVACNKVLELDSANVKALEMLASVHLENGNESEAKTILMHCVELCPEDGHSKYFSLAQIFTGKESVDFYQKGIAIVKKKLESPEAVSSSEDSQETVLCRLLSDAYCSVAEMFYTDCCDEDDAENQCRSSIENAIQADETNPEPYQCLANFHLIKGEIEESKSAMEKSLSLWLPQFTAINEGKLPLKEDTNYQIPIYDTRLNTSKMLIELEMLDQAVDVLEGLIGDDDEVTEVWYLMGWTHYLQENKENALHYFKKAIEVYKKTGAANEEQMEHINELMEEMSDLHDSEDSDVGQDNFPSESEESDNENCDVEMNQDNV